MTTSLRDSRTLLLASLLAAALAVTSCAASGAPAPASSPSLPLNDGVDGGGAAEVASPALALVAAGENGELTLLDLETEERSALAQAGADAEDAAVAGGGRFLLVTRETADETSVDVIDSGRWTVPHGDHSHSFVGDAGELGTVEGQGPVDIRIGDSATVIRFGTEVTLIDHEKIDEIEDAPRLTLSLEPSGPVLPFSGHLLAATRDAVEILDSDGVATGINPPCAAATDADITRAGAVFACADGAVLITREIGGALAAETIPYPAGSEPAPDLAGRAHRPDLAGVAGTHGAWLLDSRIREWMLLATDTPLVRVAAIGDDESRTVAIASDGTVRVLAADGSELARTEPLIAASVADPALRDRVQLIVDAQHAYVSDPATGAVHEIDHRDGAAVARTFDDLDSRYLQLVG